MRARARNSSTLIPKRGSSMEMAARGERSLAVLSYIHRASHCVAVDRPFERVADAGSLEVVVAAAAQIRSRNVPADVAGQKLAAMAAHELIALLLEEERVSRVVTLVGDLDIPLPAGSPWTSRGRRAGPPRWIRKQRMNPRRHDHIVA